ncbi:MAG TPA: PrsW family glutamic-type intramembrane protease, partial [Vicinamibacteria bacterium]
IVGLGMSVEESLYVLRTPMGLERLLYPLEVVRLLGHLVMGGIAGFGVGWARLRSTGWRRALVLSITAAVLFHFSWDWIALLSDGRSLSPKLTVLASAVMLAGLATYGSLVVLGSTLSRSLFAPSSPKRLWGFPFRSR